jgi:hypothetical protein
MDLRLIAQGLRLIADGLEDKGSRPIGKDPAVEEAPKPKKDRTPPEEVKEEPAEEQPGTQDEPEITLDQLQKKGKAVIRAGGREEVRELLRDFGVASLSTADPKDFLELHKALCNIKTQEA